MVEGPSTGGEIVTWKTFLIFCAGLYWAYVRSLLRLARELLIGGISLFHAGVLVCLAFQSLGKSST